MNWPTRRQPPTPPIRRLMLTVGSLTYLNGMRYMFSITVSGIELQTLENELRITGLERIHLDFEKQEICIVIAGDFDVVCEAHNRTRQLCQAMEITEAWLTDIDVDYILTHDDYLYQETQEIVTIDDLYQRGEWNRAWLFYFDDNMLHTISHIKPGNICGYVITAEYGVNYVVSANHVVWREL